MNILNLIHLCATMGFCTLLWIVQILVYPQMAAVPATSMQRYHQSHMNRIRWIVGPLFLIEGGAATVSFVFGVAHSPMLQSLSLGLFVLGSAITFFVFVPLHSSMARGPSSGKVAEMVRFNWFRLGAETIRLFVVGALVLRQG